MNQFFDRLRNIPFLKEIAGIVLTVAVVIATALGLHFGGGSSTPEPNPPVVTTAPSETTMPTTTTELPPTDTPPTETTTPNPPSEPSQPPMEPEETIPVDITIKHFCPTDTHWLTMFIPGKVDRGVPRTEGNEDHWTSKIYLDGKNKLEWKLGRRWDYGQDPGLNGASILDKGYTSMRIVGTWVDANDGFKKYSFDKTFDIANTCREPRVW